MLSLAEWLMRVGLRHGNPFALKQADEEGERLQEYFIEHPAYNALLDAGQPRSTLMHAPRGAGKSSTRRMFEQLCNALPTGTRPLVVRLLDWAPLVERAQHVTAIRARDHLHELLRHTLPALADDPLPGAATPAEPDLAAYLAAIYQTYGGYLTPNQRRALAARGWLNNLQAAALADYDIDRLPLVRGFALLADLLAALGYPAAYVLIDGIDELAETAGDWQAGADLLAPLVGNVQLLELPGLAFKCFVPTEVVDALRQRGVLRDDRVLAIGLAWDAPLLRELLRARLDVFSDGLLHSLAPLASPELRDIDERLCALAGSPRRLLNLCEHLLLACAGDADDEHLLLQPQHFEQALRQAGLAVLAPAPTIASTPPAPAGVPLLRVGEDGSVWRGAEPIEGWQDLPDLQRNFLFYLYQRRGKLCRKQEIVDEVWRARPEPAGDDALRKLAERVIAFVEPDANHPVYIHKVRGGHYRLDNAAPSGAPSGAP